MAVEGAHDSSIHINAEDGITSFTLTGSNTASRNDTYVKIGAQTWSGNNHGGSFYNKISVGEVASNRWSFTTHSRADDSRLSNILIMASSSLPEYPWQITGAVSSQLNFGVDAALGNFDVFQNGFPQTNLRSIENITFSQTVQEEEVNIVGKEDANKSITGPTQTAASIDKILNRKDIIFLAKEQTGINGQFVYGGNLLNFENACLNNYSVNATVGELPTASFDLNIYGGISGASIPISGDSYQESSGTIISPNDLKVTFDKNSSNAVQSFSFAESYNKEAIYGLGDKKPKEIQKLGQINQEATISIEVEDYEAEETYSFLSGTKDRDRTIKLEIGNPVQNTYELQNASLVDEAIGLGAGGTPIASLTYRGRRPQAANLVAFSFEIVVSNFLPSNSDQLALAANGVSNVTTKLRSTFNSEEPTIIPTITNYITNAPTQYVDKSDLLNDNYPNSLQTNIDRTSDAGGLNLVLTKIAKVEGFSTTADNFILNISSLIQKTSSTNDYNTLSWKNPGFSSMDIYLSALAVMEDFPSNNFNFGGTTYQLTSAITNHQDVITRGVRGVIPLYATNYQSSVDYPGSDYGLGDEGSSETTNNNGLVGSNNIQCSANIRIKNPSLLNGKTLVIPPFNKPLAL